MPLGRGVPLSRYYGTKEADQIRLNFHILLFRIIYGSRLSYDVDLYLPRGYVAAVRIGEQVFAGQSVIARVH